MNMKLLTEPPHDLDLYETIYDADLDGNSEEKLRMRITGPVPKGHKVNFSILHCSLRTIANLKHEIDGKYHVLVVPPPDSTAFANFFLKRL